MTLENAKQAAASKGFNAVHNFLGTAKPLASLKEVWKGEWLVEEVFGKMVIRQYVEKPQAFYSMETYVLGVAL
jgi:hypothetical protein